MSMRFRNIGLTLAGLGIYLAAYVAFRAWYRDWAVYQLAENAQILRALGYPIGNAVDLPAFDGVVRVGAVVPAMALLVALPVVISAAARFSLPTWSRCVILFTHASLAAFYIA